MCLRPQHYTHHSVAVVAIAERCSPVRKDGQRASINQVSISGPTVRGGKRLFINSETRPLHANEGNQTTRKGISGYGENHSERWKLQNNNSERSTLQGREGTRAFCRVHASMVGEVLLINISLRTESERGRPWPKAGCDFLAVL